MPGPAEHADDASTNPLDADHAVDGPLAGIRVLDVSTVLAGPFACQLLGDLGADVIKVEHPDGGDPMRTLGPDRDGVGLWWKVYGRNKRSVALDLHDQDCQEIFLRLVETADVLVENFRPGTLARWDLGPERLRERNPRLILAHITGFGQTGPYAERQTYGTIAEAMSGVASLARSESGAPVLPVFGIADGTAGISTALAVVAALYRRDLHREPGQEIDMSLVEPLMALIGPQPTVYSELGAIPKTTSNGAFRDLYRTRDEKWVAISAVTAEAARRVVTAIGRPELAEPDWFRSTPGREAHDEELAGYIRDWMADHTRAECLETFQRASAAIAPIYDSADILDDPQFRHRDMFATFDDPDLGTVRMQNPIFRYSGTPTRIRHVGRELGRDTDDLLVGELGIDPQRIADLRAKGLIA